MERYSFFIDPQMKMPKWDIEIKRDQIDQYLTLKYPAQVLS